MKRFSLLTLAAVVMFLAVGCAKPPQDDISATQAEMDKARQAQAETWAANEFRGANEAMNAAQAALYHFHAVPKHPLPAKIFGVYRQRVANAESRLLRGFGAEFPVPVSRHTEVRAADLPEQAGLTVLAESAEAGLCLIEDRENRAVCMFNHLEYDAGTLREEFLRDRLAGKPVGVPANYFPDNDPTRFAMNVWRPPAALLFGNWLREIRRTAWSPVVDEPPAPDGSDLPISAADRFLASALHH